MVSKECLERRDQRVELVLKAKLESLEVLEHLESQAQQDPPVYQELQDPPALPVLRVQAVE